MSKATLDQARVAKRKAIELLAEIPELRGIGIAPLIGGGFGLKVNLLRATEGVQIPAEIDGVPVIVEIVGPVRPLKRDRPG
jgi:hypothetical protein